MNQEKRKPYYIDFVGSGGVVEIRPTKVLPELVFTGKIKSQLELELEQHTRMVQDILGESARKGLGIDRQAGIARRELFKLLLPSFPGIVELKDNFYTGWFYTTENGQIYSSDIKKNNGRQSPYMSQNGKPLYFWLDSKQAGVWNQRIKQSPLTIDAISELFKYSGIELHPFYQAIAILDLKELVDKVNSVGDGFWNIFRTFAPDDKSDAKREFLRNNLLDLEILNRVHGRSHRMALAEIRELMERNEITVFPLGQDRCIVRYISDIRDKNKVGGGQATTRTLPLPHNLIRHFQRYGRFGERPMTKEEFEALYRRLVDPNTKLFS